MTSLHNREVPAGKVVLTLILSLLILLAFELRFTAVAYSEVDQPIRADAKDYILYAYNLNEHGVYSRSSGGYESLAPPPPDAVRSPGYPLFLYGFIKDLDNAELKLVLNAQALMSGICVILVFLICIFIMPAPWALIATFLTAISPHLINANIYFLTESLFAFTLLCGLVLLALAVEKQKNWLWFGIGIAFGITTLVRPTIQYFPILLILLLYIQLPRRTASLCSALFFIGFSITFGPWLIRNLLAIGSTSDSTLMINFLHHGMYPGFEFQGNKASFGFPYYYDPDSARISTSVSSALLEIARRFLESPAEHLKWYLFGKPTTLWSWNIIQGMGDSFIYPVVKSPYAFAQHFQVTHLISFWTHWAAIFLAFAGSILCWIPGCRNVVEERKLLILRVISLLLIYITGIHMIGAPFPRYSIPFRPVIYLSAVATLYTLFTLHLNSKSLNRKNFANASN